MWNNCLPSLWLSLERVPRTHLTYGQFRATPGSGSGGRPPNVRGYGLAGWRPGPFPYPAKGPRVQRFRNSDLLPESRPSDAQARQLIFGWRVGTERISPQPVAFLCSGHRVADEEARPISSYPPNAAAMVGSGHVLFKCPFL
jgi:hypothetical protein